MGSYVVFDLDGVMYRGGEACPGAVEAVTALRRMGARIAFLTNNATRHRADVVRHLASLGIPATLDEICTSGRLAALHIAQELRGKRVFVVGEVGLVQELRELDIPLTLDFREAGVVIVGLDRKATYAKLRDAHVAIMRGATFIATNRDVSFPVEGGLTWPAAGSLVAALETSTGIVPLQFGKPSPAGLEVLAGEWGCGPHEMVAVGDRLDTDMASARAFGCTAVLVLTGVATREDAAAAPPECRPDCVIQTLAELPKLIEGGLC